VRTKIERREIFKSIRRRKFPGSKERSILHIERFYPMPRRIKKDAVLEFQKNKNRWKTLKVSVYTGSSKRNGNQLCHPQQ